MNFIELFLMAVGLSMDAFAVSVCKGLAMPKINFRNAMICGVWFGGFQALMPVIGYILGSTFAVYVERFSPWIAFILLALIGGNMIREALSDEEEAADAGLDIKTMFVMAVATSIDALAIGITFACVPLRIFGLADATAPVLGMSPAILALICGVLIIGITTCILSCIGVKLGNVFGTRYKSKAEIAGGIILICIGLKILIQHLL